jgi:hypothetical protein
VTANLHDADQDILEIEKLKDDIQFLSNEKNWQKLGYLRSEMKEGVDYPLKSNMKISADKFKKQFTEFTDKKVDEELLMSFLKTFG